MKVSNIELNYSQIESISQLLGNALTGSQITDLFKRINVVDDSGESTKWRRLNAVFSEYKHSYNSCSIVFRFLNEVLQPSRYVNDERSFDTLRNGLNLILSFSGFEYGEDGNLKPIGIKIATISEAKRRTNSLRQKLSSFGVHQRVFVYCAEELLQENYFQVVFESAKSLADEVRYRTGLMADGSELFEKALSISSPYLLLNDLQTQSEKSRQVGLCKMLCGVFSFFRNVGAHEPHIKWAVNEADAINALQIISFLHFQLDSCVTCRCEK